MSTVLVLEAMAHVITVVAGIILVYQLHLILKQRRMETFLLVRKTNRDLIQMGIERPELLKTLGGKERSGVTFRYLQLWLNHLHAAFMAYRDGSIPHGHWESMEHDIADFARVESVAKHWKKTREFYPDDFQHFMDRLAKPPA